MPSIDRHSSSPAVGSGNTVLSSDWTGLSRHLLASFFPVEKVDDGPSSRWQRVPGSFEVHAPLTDGAIEQTQNWTSPFEQTGLDSKLSSFSSLLQTGGFNAIVNALGQHVEKDAQAGITGQVSQGLSRLMGRSGVTKLNSTQVYSGSPPLKLTFVAHFRALFDAIEEVRRPVDMLMGWAVPQKLAADGILTNVIRDGVALRTIYGSLAPQVIGMRYGTRLFKPMVIESIGQPLTAPIDMNGNVIFASLQMTVASLTALDRDDWIAIGN